jgi:hypothetical protein
MQTNKISSFPDLLHMLPQNTERIAWLNLGGQLVPQKKVQQLINDIKNNTVKNWDAIHATYEAFGRDYEKEKLHHAFASLLEITGIRGEGFTPKIFKQLLEEALVTKAWMFETIYKSRAKDYQNEFRKMIYDTEAEMEEVIGKLEDNAFIKSQQEELDQFRQSVKTIIQNLNA